MHAPNEQQAAEQKKDAILSPISSKTHSPTLTHEKAEKKHPVPPLDRLVPTTSPYTIQ